MNSIRLVDVYSEPAESRLSTLFLYELLKERDPIANISHHEMPTFKQHRDFVDSLPYKSWYTISVVSEPQKTLLVGETVGAVYLTYLNEIGISILKARQGRGYGETAVRMLMAMNHGKRFLANIAPGNARSIAMFEGLGFKTIQITKAKEPE
jgi:RimJ/RimL family protein N-acetyltransferase